MYSHDIQTLYLLIIVFIFLLLARFCRKNCIHCYISYRTFVQIFSCLEGSDCRKKKKCFREIGLFVMFKKSEFASKFYSCVFWNCKSKTTWSVMFFSIGQIVFSTNLKPGIRKYCEQHVLPELNVHESQTGVDQR